NRNWHFPNNGRIERVEPARAFAPSSKVGPSRWRVHVLKDVIRINLWSATNPNQVILMKADRKLRFPNRGSTQFSDIRMSLDNEDVIPLKDASVVLAIHANVFDFGQIDVKSLNVCHSKIGRLLLNFSAFGVDRQPILHLSDIANDLCLSFILHLPRKQFISSRKQKRF